MAQRSRLPARLVAARIADPMAARRNAMPMLYQVALGSLLMTGTILLAGLTVWVLEVIADKGQAWFVREPQRVKMMLAVMGMSLWSLATITGGVWLWATTFYHLQAFPTLEESVYFTLVSFTTLGYGDVVLPKGLRLLGGMVAVNGMLNIGLLTALLIETIRALRGRQSQRMRR
jgi:hypothetical protein